MTPVDPADFASLLEREPYEPKGLEDIQPRKGKKWEPARILHGLAAERRECYGNKSEAAAAMEAGANAIEICELRHKPLLSSAVDRIKSLEDVLVLIRAGATGAESYRHNASMLIQKHRNTVALISETLDPCKPWCMLESGHGGKCEPADEERD